MVSDRNQMLAAGSLPTLISGFPIPSILSGIVETVTHSHFLERRESATSYAVFGGNGETSDGWPAMSDWVSDFDTMFASHHFQSKYQLTFLLGLLPIKESCRAHVLNGVSRTTPTLKSPKCQRQSSQSLPPLESTHDSSSQSSCKKAMVAFEHQQQTTAFATPGSCNRTMEQEHATMPQYQTLAQPVRSPR